jgi:hypothetical protein
MGEDEIEIGMRATYLFDLSDPLILHAASERGAEVEEEAERLGVLARLEEFDGIEAVRGFKFAADIIVHRSKTRGVASAFERFEVELGKVDAIPIKAVNQILDSC